MIEKFNSKTIRVFPLVAAGSIIFLLYLSVKRPYLFGESNLIGLMVLVAAGLFASQYQTHFWTLMIAVFFWAGSGFPPSWLLVTMPACRTGFPSIIFTFWLCSRWLRCSLLPWFP